MNKRAFVSILVLVALMGLSSIAFGQEEGDECEDCNQAEDADVDQATEDEVDQAVSEDEVYQAIQTAKSKIQTAKSNAKARVDAIVCPKNFRETCEVLNNLQDQIDTIELTPGLGYSGLISDSAVTIEMGSKSFATNLASTDTAFVVGDRVRVIYTTNPTNFMEGLITSYTGTTLIVNVDYADGDETEPLSPWTISLAGAVGAIGPQGVQGIQGLKGDKGDQGVQGIQGIQGLKGDKGDQGEVGPVGPAGVSTLFTGDGWQNFHEFVDGNIIPAPTDGFLSIINRNEGNFFPGFPRLDIDAITIAIVDAGSSVVIPVKKGEGFCLTYPGDMDAWTKANIFIYWRPIAI